VTSKCSDLEQTQKDSQWEIELLKEDKEENEVALKALRSSLSTLTKEKESLTMEHTLLKNELETCQQDKKSAEDELAASNIERHNLTSSLKSTTVRKSASALYI
jgi:chromosome segregation ATPase